jgi:hypothetical protein
MGTFAQTANVVYRLSLADQEKQTSVFPGQKINRSLPGSLPGSLPFPFLYTYIYIYIETAEYIYAYKYISIISICLCLEKWKMKAQKIFLNLFTVCPL